MKDLQIEVIKKGDIKRKKLMAWNGFYGFESFEVFIAYGETLEEKKKYYEDLGYKCWIEIERDDKNEKNN